MQQEYETEYFWRKSRLVSRGRFNLLLLEYGEIFYENLSVFQYPVPNHNLKFAECDSLKVKGRLHVCSRSIIFEPSDIKRPLLKFPYRTITSELENFRLKPEEIAHCSVTASGFATFRCSGYFELKGNDQVGPYKLVDCSSSHNHNDSGKVLCTESSFVFALVHTDSSAFFSTIRRLRDEINGNSEGGGLISLRSQHLPQKSSKAVSFDSSQLVDFHEQLLFSEPISCVRVGPLVLHPGCLMVTGSRIYFQPSNLNNIGDSVQHFNVSKIKRVFSRRYLLRQTGVEIFFADSVASNDVTKNLSSVYFVFESTEVRDRVVSAIESLASFPAEVGIREKSIHSMTQNWQQKKVSNFEYLLFLNSEADRSFSDLTQYPIMPHVICDYQSRKLDLTKPETFRDLTKPIGALNPQRLAFFKERYQSMSSVATEASASGASSFPPPFLYGTHYSTPGYVLYYLVRVAPEHMLCLQNGKFDAADRMFYSVAGMFASCLSNPADLKELIPEFFHGEGEFLSNNESLNLGRRHNGERVDDVELPPWAKSPKDFVKKSRQALESDYVSDRLHHWIDLIFGYKQRGEEALLADNLFYHLTYEGALDLESDLSPGAHPSQRTQGENRKMMEREAIDVQIQEFGQTPKQLFSSPHPRRGDTTAVQVLSRTPEVAVARQVKSTSAAAGKAAVNEVRPKEKNEAPQEVVADVPHVQMQMKGNAGDAVALAAPVLSSSSEGSTCTVVEPRHAVRADSATPLKSARMTNGQEKTAGGMILLGEDFRAEVTRQLQAQHAAGMTAEPSYHDSSGALVVKPKESASIGKSCSEDTGIRGANNLNTPGASPAIRSNQASPPFERDGAVSAQMQTPTQPKSTMQSLWGTFTEKTISMIRPDKGLGIGIGLGLGLGRVASPIQAAQSQSPAATESLAFPEKDMDKVSSEAVARRGAPTDPSAKVTAQLCCLKSLPRKVPISGISALQVSSNDGKCRIIICATARDATVNVYLSDVLRSKTESAPPAPRADDEGWKSMGELHRKDDQRDAAFTALDPISSFTAGAVSSPAATIFRPLGLLPQMLSTAFSLQPQSPPYNSSCRLSTDATRVLISSQRGLDCALYSYSIPESQIIEQNVIRVDSGLVINSKTDTCIAFGRGSQCLVCGSHDGKVRLWSLSLQTVSTSAAGYGLSGTVEVHSQALKDKEGKRQKALAEFIEVQSPILCVNQVVTRSATGTSSTDSSICRLVVAAGSMDGTVAVWSSDIDTDTDTLRATNCRLLFCHQLRPSERSVVCVEWLPERERELTARKGDSDGGHAKGDIKLQLRHIVLLTGAVDGALHCVDIAGRVLAICEILGAGGSRSSSDASDESYPHPAQVKPRLTAMSLSHSSDSSGQGNGVEPSIVLVFCGFSDGSIHIISLVRTCVRIETCSKQQHHPQSGRASDVDASNGSRRTEKYSDLGESETREVIQMSVVLIIDAPVVPPSLPIAITALCWIKGSSAEKILKPAHSKADTPPDTGTLVSGDEEGHLKIYRISIARSQAGAT